MNRVVNELIWHCSATRKGQHFTVEDIRNWHVARGWSDIGYHRVVYLDGTVRAGRDMERTGAHVKGRNTGTLGYCYIGGVDIDGKPMDTRTAAQKASMAKLTHEAMRDYGITKVTGHNEYANKACPSFDVQTDPVIQAAMGRRVAPAHTVPQPVMEPATKERTTIWSLLLKLFQRFFGSTGGQ